MYYYLISDTDTVFDGPIVYYYHNGIVEDSIIVHDGNLNGNHYSFDTLGKLYKKQLDSGGITYEKDYYLDGRLNSYSIWKDKNLFPTYSLEYDSNGIKTEFGDSTLGKKDGNLMVGIDAAQWYAAQVSDTTMMPKEPMPVTKK